MKALAALACAALLTAPATPPPKWSDARPPERFQGTGFVPVVFLPSTAIAEACAVIGTPPAGWRIRACTRHVGLDDGTVVAVVVMPDPCEYPGEFAHIQCHENSHYLSGWRHATQ